MFKTLLLSKKVKKELSEDIRVGAGQYEAAAEKCHVSQTMSAQETGPSLSQYFGSAEDGGAFFDGLPEAQSGAPLAPLTPINNSLANIGNLDYISPILNQSPMTDPQQSNIPEPAVCKLFADSTKQSSVQFNKMENPFSPTASTAHQTPFVSMPLPDPSTFFDNIGPSSVSNIQLFDQPMSPSFNPSDISLEKLSLTESQSSVNETDRKRDAWIPSEETMKILIQAQRTPVGSFVLDKYPLTMPGVALESDLSDELYNIVAHHLGEEEAVQRGTWGCEHVTQDERGLKELIQAGCFRAAINLTSRLLTNYGQGIRRSGHPSKHSPRSLQLWFTRLALLVKIQMYSLCEREAEAFNNLQNSDIYFQYYPDIYPNRSGSMASFSFRLLLAELPMHSNKPEIAIARLHGLLDVIRKIIRNLNDSKCEEGSDKPISSQDRQDSLKLWSGREMRVQFSVVNCALQMKDYTLAIQIVEGMMNSPPWNRPDTLRALHSALGRICLQAGHIPGAETHFRKATQLKSKSDNDTRELVDQSLLAVAQNAFDDAYNALVKANQLEPANIMVLNNMAVCLLYSGKLKEAIGVMENAVNSNPSRGLSETLLLNLCTLYELESSNTMPKKLALLQQLCKYKRDTVSDVTTYLKLNT